MADICAVIPAYNEAASVARVAAGALDAAGCALVVDDGSTDGTAEAAAAAGARVVRHKQNRGKGAAIATGLAWARGHGYEAAVFLDGDGQHDPGEICRLVEAYRQGADIVLGSRMQSRAGMPPLRAFTNFLTSLVTSCIAGCRISDSQSGFRLLRIDTAGWMAAEAGRFESETEILIRAARRGMKIRDVPVSTIYAGEQSKIDPSADTGRFILMALRLIFIERQEVHLGKPHCTAGAGSRG